MSLHHHHRQPPQQNPQNPNHLQHQPIAAFGHHEADHYPQIQQTITQGYPFAPKSRSQQSTFSDEDEPGVTAEDSAGDGKTKISSWH
ncbi:hypothetical protein Q8G47_28235, partial [Klebsiella pneumoniae]|uniref:hypothetical protein n=1 Tax=Klebsiella pneumoniae TaxID=573 RepID=UPI00301404C1